MVEMNTSGAYSSDSLHGISPAQQDDSSWGVTSVQEVAQRTANMQQNKA